MLLRCMDFIIRSIQRNIISFETEEEKTKVDTPVSKRSVFTIAFGVMDGFWDIIKSYSKSNLKKNYRNFLY